MPSLSLSSLNTPSICWDDVLPSSSTSSACTPRQLEEEVQKQSENTIVQDAVRSDDVTAARDCHLQRSDSVAALTSPVSKRCDSVAELSSPLSKRSDSVAELSSPLSKAKVPKEQNDVEELKDVQTGRLCRRIVKTASRNAPINLRLLNVEREMTFECSETVHRLVGGLINCFKLLVMERYMNNVETVNLLYSLKTGTKMPIMKRILIGSLTF